MKLFELINAQGVLVELNNCKSLSAVTAYRISKNIKLFENELKLYEEQRMKMLKDLADKDEQGEPIVKEKENGQTEYVLSEENRNKLAEELSNLLNEEVDADFKKIELEQLNNVCLSPAQIGLISFMIDEGE